MKLSDCQTFIDLQDRVTDLESLSSTDDQELQSFEVVGGNLVLTLEDGGVAEVPLTDLQIPDNTDDQQIEQFEIVGNNVVLTLEDGGTASIPLSAFDFDTDISGVSLSIDSNGLITVEIKEDSTVVSDTLQLQTRDVDFSSIATYDLSGDGNASGDEEMTLAPTRQDTGWVEAGDSVEWTGPIPDYIEVNAHAFYDTVNNAGFQRVSPEMQLVRTRGGADQVLAHSGTGYQRHASGHNNSSNNLYMLISDHQAGDQYRVRARQGGTQNDTVNTTLGHASFKAVEKVSVVTI